MVQYHFIFNVDHCPGAEDKRLVALLYTLPKTYPRHYAIENGSLIQKDRQTPTRQRKLSAYAHEPNPKHGNPPANDPDAMQISLKAQEDQRPPLRPQTRSSAARCLWGTRRHLNCSDHRFLGKIRRHL